MNQVATNADGYCAGANKVGGILLIDAARGDEWNLRERRFQRADITRAANLHARKDLDEVHAGFPRGHDFTRCQSTGKQDGLAFVYEVYDLEVETGRGNESCSCIETLLGCCNIENRTDRKSAA